MAPVFQFRLQVLLDQKRQLEKQARLAMVEKQRLLNEANLQLERLKRKEEEIQQKLRDATSGLLVETGSNRAFEVHRRNNYREGLTGDLKDAHQAALAQKFAVEEAESELAQARAHALHCSREVEKFEKYREKQEALFLAEAERKEQLEQDELGTVMFLSGRK